MHLPEPQNNNNNTTTCLGTPYSNFDPITAQKLFCWELSARDIRNILRNGSAWSSPIKQIEYNSDALYRAQFSIKLNNSGEGTLEVKIVREIFPDKINVNSSITFIVNSNCRMYGINIERSVFAHVIGLNGTIKIIAACNPPDEDENIELPEDI